MKSWVFAAFLISGCALVACGDDNTDPPNTGTTTSSSNGSGGSGTSGGNGGNGGEAGGGGSGGDGGAGAASSSSTGIPTCDDTTDECGRSDNSGCYKCATDGPCKEALDSCVSDREQGGCLKLAQCVDKCSDEAEPETCIEGCRTDHANGVEAFDALIQCTICQECADSCGASEEPLCAM
ncbi:MULTISPECIES: hypothetical protein [Sorangium]|uniref:Secreted protein n=1 Tax=Sorangium cellulosum TaxID=56 RepID=A0A4V0NHG0_SORCE|nr:MULTISPECIES: hypothetical protein [Sorangium]AUX36542.1 hypothetical protein SOCE836_087500 [Sorangium cellulosum]WCQ95840.1 hypothetical protein NQZ70_08617 [Sorangium sp. Soce836]